MDKMLQDSNGDLTVTNDGATILERMELDNQIGKLLVELSRSQDYEIGDGTTGVTILAASLLEMAEPLIDMGIHPLRVAEGYEVGCRIAMANLDKIAQKFVFRESDVEPMVRACMTALSSKIVGRCQRSLAEVCGWAVLAVADLQRRDINLELIKVEGKLGGGLGDTTLVNGIVVEKEMAHPQMQKWVSNARIAILTCPFEPPKPKTKHSVEIETVDEFDTLRAMEHDYFVDMVKMCKASHTNIVICQWGFDDEANHLLMHHALPAVRWVGGVEIELIAMATGARIVPRFQELTVDKLGSAKVVREVGFGTTKDKVIFIEGCSGSRAVTLLVRGGNKMVLDETKRSLRDALCVAKIFIGSSSIVYGGGAAELSCSLTVSEAAETTTGILQHSLGAFAHALEQIPMALAENAGLNPIETLMTQKAKQLRDQNPYIGVDCNDIGISDMRKQNVFETYLGKKQQLLLSTQVCKMILKIDDIISPNNNK
jgi:T-complex protein 1 subunit epsilon